MAYDKADRKPMRKGHKKVCSFCVDKVEFIDYKDIDKLRKYTSERAKILIRESSQQPSSVRVTLLFFPTRQTDKQISIKPAVFLRVVFCGF